MCIRDRRTTALQGMRSNLNMESSRWARANRRLKAINTLSLTLITQSCEKMCIRDSSKVLGPLWSKVSILRYHISGPLDDPQINEVLRQPRKEKAQ